MILLISVKWMMIFYFITEEAINMKNKKIVGTQCIFVTHIPGKYNVRDDVHIVKERVYFEDGTSTPRLRSIKNYERPYWITSKSYRNHVSKKEWEDEDKLDKYTITQTDLRNDVAKKLELSYSRDSLKKLCKSPYVYGCDVSSTSLIKKEIMDENPDYIKSFTVAAYDTETSMVNNTLLMSTICFDRKIYTAVCKDFVGGIHDPIEKIKKAMTKYLTEFIDMSTLEVEIEIVDTELDVAIKSIGKAHEWKPDFLSMWNMDFDVNVLIDVCERAGVDPKLLFSDPKLPNQYKTFYYRAGATQKQTSSGKHIPINPAMRWHTVITPASFYIIDAMCTYKHLRISEPEVPTGYGLDSILNKELGVRKLKFKEADGYSGGGWHTYMQKHHPIEYIVYNQWDTLSMVLLDEKTLDLSSSLPGAASFSDLSDFSSQPKRITDVLHHVVQKKGKVIATAGAKYDDDFVDDSKHVLGLNFWIMTLNSHMVTNNGLRLIQEDRSIRTNTRGHVYDSDAVSSYPSNTQAANMSKETTIREIIHIDVPGHPDLFKHQNINMMAGVTNSIEYSVNMFGLPNLNELNEIYNKDKS